MGMDVSSSLVELVEADLVRLMMDKRRLQFQGPGVPKLIFTAMSETGLRSGAHRRLIAAERRPFVVGAPMPLANVS